MYFYNIKLFKSIVKAAIQKAVIEEGALTPKNKKKI